MDKIETKEYKGYTIEIYQDEAHVNPLEEWDWEAKLACFHKRYDLVNHENLDHNDYDSWEAMEKYIKKEYNPKHIQTVYMYEHGCSPVVFSFGKTCDWDSGQVGFIWGDCMKEIEDMIKMYNQYENSEVYGFIIKDNEGKEIESCWGFWGDYDDYLLTETKGIIDNKIKRKKEVEAISQTYCPIY
jgi:hypothetical protein